jgi:hypothetical protein
MSSVLETLSLKELYTRKKNLIFQLDKVDEEIKKRFLENGNDIEIEISPYKDDIKQPLKKLVIKKNIDNVIETEHENTLQTNNEPQIIRKITLKIKK